MPSVARDVDVEQGAIQLHSHLIWEANDERSVVSMSNYVAGVLLFLFLAGLLPLSLLVKLSNASTVPETVLASVLLVCLATCIRAYVMHQFEQSLQSGQSLNTLAEALSAVSATQPILGPGQQIDVQNLRLSLIQRDFGASDYESLVALDATVALAPGQAVSDDLIAALPSFRHCRGSWPGQRAKQGEEHLCCVCLEPYTEGAAVTRLPCAHGFHCDCIQPWLRQQGKMATCPLCKAAVWPQK